MTAVLAVLVAVSLIGLVVALAQLLFLPRPRRGSLAESWPYPPGAPRHPRGPGRWVHPSYDLTAPMEWVPDERTDGRGGDAGHARVRTVLVVYSAVWLAVLFVPWGIDRWL